jgi:hypothetical protein
VPIHPLHDASPTAKAGLGVFSLLVLAYSILIAGQILLGLLIVVFVVTLYVGLTLLFRFVRAFERLADAAEAYAERGQSISRGADS